MKILILMIYNDTNEYRQMLNLQKQYINNDSDIDTYFIQFKNQEHDIIVEDNLISFKGEENAMNILNKTILAFEYLFNTENKKYDFVIRSNISTMINLKNLKKVLENSPKNNLYSGGICLHHNWLDYKYGIYKETIEKHKLKNFKFVQGTSIILSFDVANIILNNQHLLDKTIIDDVSIALFLRDNYQDTYNNVFYHEMSSSVNSYNPNAVFIRNNSYDIENINRKLDIERITQILQHFKS
jgi:hypothetical protein